METPPARPRFSDVRRVAETGSTNDDLFASGRQGAPEGIVLVAGHQRTGRGRRGRTWSAPPGSGLLCSVLLRPPARVAELVTATVAVALHDAFTSLGITGVGIKWPNDLIVASPDGDRKVAGILAEADAPVGSGAASGHRVAADGERVLVVVGTGVNVHTPDQLPADVADRYIALDGLVTDESRPAPGVEDVLAAYLEALDTAYSVLLDDRDVLLERWRARCVTLGRRVRVDLGARDLHGVARRIDDQGRLVVEGTDGSSTTVAAGDVVHLRDR